MWRWGRRCRFVLPNSLTSPPPRPGRAYPRSSEQTQIGLRELDLSWNELRDEGGLPVIEALETCAIQTLKMPFNSLGPSVGVRLGGLLPSLLHLRSLDVSNNAFDEAAALAIAEVCGRVLRGREGGLTRSQGLRMSPAVATLLVGFNRLGCVAHIGDMRMSC